MATTNATVAEIVKRVRRECNSYPLPNAAGEMLRLVRDVEAAHKREVEAEIADKSRIIRELNEVRELNRECCDENERLKGELAAKDNEIDKLEGIRREYINMQSNVTALRQEVSLKQSQHIAQCREYRDKIAKLRECAKEVLCGVCLMCVRSSGKACADGHQCESVSKWRKALEGSKDETK